VEGKFIQEIKNGIIKLKFHEKYKNIVDNLKEKYSIVVV
jgi:hypothetical protein